MQIATVQDQVRVIKALAHPARLEIAQALADGERSVSELQVLSSEAIFLPYRSTSR